jgi:short-subunit dehydrogenase
MTERNTFPMPFLISPERAARAIVAGIEKDKAEVVFPVPMMVLMKVARLVPARTWTAFTARLARRGMRSR